MPVFREARRIFRLNRNLQYNAEELLLSERIFWCRNRCQQWVFFSVTFTVSHQISRSFGYLYPVNVGLHFKLFHKFPGLSYACSVVASHWSSSCWCLYRKGDKLAALKLTLLRWSYNGFLWSSPTEGGLVLFTG